MLLAIGGFDGQAYLKAVEALDPAALVGAAPPGASGSSGASGSISSLSASNMASEPRRSLLASSADTFAAAARPASPTPAQLGTSTFPMSAAAAASSASASASAAPAVASGWRHHSTMNYRRLGGGVGVVRLLPSAFTTPAAAPTASAFVSQPASKEPPFYHMNME